MDQFLCAMALSAAVWGAVFRNIHISIMGVTIALILVSYKFHESNKRSES